MKELFSFFVFLTAFAASSPGAAPIPVPAGGLDRDLGRGLLYHRVHMLPEDLPAAGSGRQQPSVLDLRYVHGDSTAAATLAAWLKFNATPRAPVFVLANSDTSHALLAPFLGRDSAGSVVLLGAAAPGFNPDIAVRTSRDAERRAYDALETGAAIDSLLVENVDKPRNDEAQLARDRGPDSAPADSAEGPPNRAAPVDRIAAIEPPGLPDDAKSAKLKLPAPPIDAVLQRAVQLHRTLLALKKI